MVLSGNADLVFVGEFRIDECLFFPIALLENAISFPESNDPQYIPSPSPIKTSNNNDLMVECTLFKTIMSESYCTSTIIIFIRYLFFLNAILNKR